MTSREVLGEQIEAAREVYRLAMGDWARSRMVTDRAILTETVARNKAEAACDRVLQLMRKLSDAVART